MVSIYCNVFMYFQATYADRRLQKACLSRLSKMLDRQTNGRLTAQLWVLGMSAIIPITELSMWWKNITSIIVIGPDRFVKCKSIGLFVPYSQIDLPISDKGGRFPSLRLHLRNGRREYARIETESSQKLQSPAFVDGRIWSWRRPHHKRSLLCKFFC